jgi:hypothetical protein
VDSRTRGTDLRRLVTGCSASRAKDGADFAVRLAAISAFTDRIKLRSHAETKTAADPKGSAILT